MLYAIGEIILVVIGILIALQISDWSDDQKNEAQRTILIESLQNDLKADLELLTSDLKYLEDRLKEDSSFAKRLSSSEANQDTLVKIVRYEHETTTRSMPILDQTTFNSLESTGQIDLLENELLKKVQQYYLSRSEDASTADINIKIYFNLVEYAFREVFVSGMHSAIKGPLQDLYWKNMDLHKLQGAFNALLTMRLFTIDSRTRRQKQLIIRTEELINYLDSVNKK